jgi:YVTN family beta-propeller protein
MTDRRLRLLFLACSFVLLALPAAAQQVIATVPIGIAPRSSAVNPATNKIYVPSCGTDPNCSSIGTLTVIDGATNDILAVINVGYSPLGVAVNAVTN